MVWALVNVGLCIGFLVFYLGTNLQYLTKEDVVLDLGLKALLGWDIKL